MVQWNVNKQKEKELKITEEEVIRDVKRMFDTGDYKLPVTEMNTSFCSGWGRAECRVVLMQDSVELGVLVRFVNFYLEKKAQRGEVFVTTNEDGECVLVSRQDEDHNILKVIWEKK